MKGEFEQKIRAVLIFMSMLSKEEVAEYIVHQQDAIDGQLKNIDLWVKAFKKYDEDNRVIKIPI